MILINFKCTDWRVIENVNIDFHPGTNLITGDNGVGKSSVLKGIAYCLALSPTSRFNAKTDIRGGAEKATLSLTIGVPSQGGYVPHTIGRTIDAKGKSTITIDGEKVSTERAAEIMTVDWGLPHPDQLRPMMALRQQELNEMLREDPVTRQEKYRQLLGYHELKSFRGPLEKLIAALNEDSLSVRSLGISTEQLDAEIITAKQQIGSYSADLANLLAPDQTRELNAALNDFIKTSEADEANTEAHTARNAVPEEFAPWLTSFDTNLAGNPVQAPSLSRLYDLAQLQEKLRFAKQLVAEKQDPANIAALIQLLERSAPHLRFQAADKAFDYALVPLTAELKDWANRVNQVYVKIGAVTPAARNDALALEGVSNANVLIERNRVAQKAQKHNEDLRDLRAHLAKLLGQAAPRKDVRSQLAQWHSNLHRLQTLATLLRIGKSALNGGGVLLKDAVAARPRALLAAKLPGSDSASSAGSQWSAQADDAVSSLWAEFDNAKGAIKQCPFSNDTVDAKGIAEAKAALQARRAAAMASTQWQAFLREVSDPELLALFKAQKVAAAISLLRQATDTYRKAITEGLATETSLFWTNAQQQSEFFRLHEKVAGYEANLSSEDRDWLASRAKELAITVDQLLSQVSKVEQSIEAAGPEKPVDSGRFPVEMEAKLLDAQTAIDNLAGAREALKTSVQLTTEELQDLQGHKVTTEAQAQSLITAQRNEQQQSLRARTQADVLTKQLADATSTLGLTDDDLNKYEALLNAFRTNGEVFKKHISAEVTDYVNKAKRASQLAASKANNAWPEKFGKAPVNLIVAQGRLATLEKQIQDYAAITGKIESTQQNIRRLQQLHAETVIRASDVTILDGRRDLFKEVEKFLQPENGPRVLMSQQFLRVIQRANEILDDLGAEFSLIGDEMFEIFMSSAKLGEFNPPASEMSGGEGNLCGVVLAQALLEYYNEASGKAGVHTLILDEPTLCIKEQIVPEMLKALSTKGRRRGMQTIIVEHNPYPVSCSDKLINLNPGSPETAAAVSLKADSKVGPQIEAAVMQVEVTVEVPASVPSDAPAPAVPGPRLNKDGSIRKKPGRKAHQAQETLALV